MHDDDPGFWYDRERFASPEEALAFFWSLIFEVGETDPPPPPAKRSPPATRH